MSSCKVFTFYAFKQNIYMSMSTSFSKKSLNVKTVALWEFRLFLSIGRQKDGQRETHDGANIGSSRNYTA